MTWFTFTEYLCVKSRFYAKKSYFFPILGGARAGCAPPLDPPLENAEITCSDYVLVAYDKIHRHSNSGPPFFLIWSLPRLWYGSLSGSISLNHLSIFYNISCYNSLVLLTFFSRSSCRITYIYSFY
jgi:hypothetical protein